jgi:uncharacterized protein
VRIEVIRIITVEREFGCGAAMIAATLAERLGWKLWDQELTQAIANEAHVDCSEVERHEERVDSRLYRLAKVFWRGSYERGTPLTTSQAFDADCMMRMMKGILDRIAEQGNAVIVGRGSPYLLRERTDAFHVFMYAPRQEKIRRLIQSGKSSREAEDLVDNVDHERIAYIKHYFNADWPTRTLYHLMINTGMGDDSVIETVIRTMNLLDVNAPRTPLTERT